MRRGRFKRKEEVFLFENLLPGGGLVPLRGPEEDPYSAIRAGSLQGIIKGRQVPKKGLWEKKGTKKNVPPEAIVGISRGGRRLESLRIERKKESSRNSKEKVPGT